MRMKHTRFWGLSIVWIIFRGYPNQYIYLPIIETFCYFLCHLRYDQILRGICCQSCNDGWYTILGLMFLSSMSMGIKP